MADTINQSRTDKRRPLTHRDAIVAELKAHASEIRKQGVTSLALFGSRARGEERQDSDLDVLIGYDSDRPFTLYDLVRVGRLLERLTGLEVHVATRDAFRPHRLHRALKDAVDVL
jgi:predicted nucleotidyltransferase